MLRLGNTEELLTETVFIKNRSGTAYVEKVFTKMLHVRFLVSSNFMRRSNHLSGHWYCWVEFSVKIKLI